MLSTVHLIIASGTGFVVLYADEQALAWFLGKRELFHPKTMSFLHRIVSVGLFALLITGGLLYLRQPRSLLSLTLFDVKMAMVFVLICNSYFIDRFSRVAMTHSYASLSVSERTPLLISGGISLIGWVAVFICGLQLA